jgi:hypothetical protein
MDAATEAELTRNAHNADWGVTQVLGLVDPADGFRQIDGKTFTVPNKLGQTLLAILAAVQGVEAPALTDAQLAAIADQVAAKLGAQLADVASKVDQLVARLTAAGDALDG